MKIDLKSVLRIYKLVYRHKRKSSLAKHLKILGSLQEKREKEKFTESKKT